MKKVFVLLGFALLLTQFTANASVEDVQSYLEQYCDENDVLDIQEYSSETYATLFIKYDYIRGNNPVLSNDSESRIIFKDLISQEWFDYQRIQFLPCPADTAFGVRDFVEFVVQFGTATYYKRNLSYPVIIKSKDDLDESTVNFLHRVVSELLKYNDIWGSIGSTGVSDNLEYQVCYNLAIVTGTCENDGKTYNFLMEFTFQNTSEWVGTYDTICVILNDVTTYGEYIPIEDYQWKIFE